MEKPFSTLGNFFSILPYTVLVSCDITTNSIVCLSVFKLLERTIPEGAPDTSVASIDNVCQAIRCSSAWLQLQLPLSMCDALSTRLINVVRLCGQGHDTSSFG